MFDRYMICESGFHNQKAEGQPVPRMPFPITGRDTKTLLLAE